MSHPLTLSKRRWFFIPLAVLLLGAVAYGLALLSGMEDEGSVENRVVIDRPPEVVFDFISDMRNELRWNPDCESMVKITDGPVGLGTKYAAKWKQSPNVTVETTRFERPRAFTAENGGDLAVTVTVTRAPEGPGTLLVSRFTARPHGFMKVIFPIFKRMMATFEKQVMLHIKKAVEGLPK